MSTDFPAGDIGPFYRRPEVNALLKSPWTDANIKAFGDKENQFFKTQPIAARLVASLLSADERAYILRRERLKYT